MSDASRFLTSWVLENVSPTMFDDRDTAEHLAHICLLEAKGEGLREADVIAAAGGNLVDFMLSELNRAVDRMINEKVARDREQELKRDRS
jgi:hypothetical protein